MNSSKDKRTFFELIKDLHDPNDLEDLIKRIEKLKSDLLNSYSEIKEQEKKDLLDAAERVESKNATERLYALAEHADKEVEEVKRELISSEEYLQSMADVIRRK